MPSTNEQRLDIIENCNHLLNKLQGYEQTDSTPEGRMISQLKWLKERAENHDLPLPVDPVMLSTLRYILVDGGISHLASNPDYDNSFYSEIELPMRRLIRLTKEGQLLLKPAYHPYAMRYLNTLLSILQQSPRPLDQYEQGLIDEVKHLQQILADPNAVLPLMTYMPDFENFIDVRANHVSVSDLAENGKHLFQTVNNLMFNGVRPDSWLTPEDADRETANL